MSAIIMKFAPLIKKAVRQTNNQDQDDLEQELLEKIISVVFNLDLNEIFLSLKGEE